MPTRVLTVTGTSPAAATAARTMFSKRRRRHGRAEPPPLRVTLGTGQPKLRSTCAGRVPATPSSTSISTARPTVAGSCGGSRDGDGAEPVVVPRPSADPQIDGKRRTTPRPAAPSSGDLTRSARRLRTGPPPARHLHHRRPRRAGGDRAGGADGD